MLKFLDKALYLCEEAHEQGRTTLAPSLLTALNTYLAELGFAPLATQSGQPIVEAIEEILALQLPYINPWPKIPRAPRILANPKRS